MQEISDDFKQHGNCEEWEIVNETGVAKVNTRCVYVFDFLQDHQALDSQLRFGGTSEILTGTLSGQIGIHDFLA